MRYEASFTACQKFLSIGKYDDQSGSSIAFHIEYEKMIY